MAATTRSAWPGRWWLCGSLLLLAPATASAVPPEAGQRWDLVPAQGAMTLSESSLRYRQLLLRLLRPIQRTEGLCARKCEMLVEHWHPDGAPEWAVYLQRDGEAARAIVRRAKRSLRLALETSATVSEADIEQVTAPLSTEDADLLEQVWELMLDRVRPRPPIAKSTHPSPVHFVHCDSSNGLREGMVDVNVGLGGELVAIGEALRAYTLSPDPGRAAARTALLSRARKLMSTLQQLGASPPSMKRRRQVKQGVVTPGPN